MSRVGFCWAIAAGNRLQQDRKLQGIPAGCTWKASKYVSFVLFTYK
jgi:hypothetical protein